MRNIQPRSISSGKAAQRINMIQWEDHEVEET